MKKLVLSVVVLMVLFSTGIAHAAPGDFFDDSGGKWWMNENWWTKDSYGTTDIGQGIGLDSNKLEVTSTTSAGGFSGYASNWSLGFDQNFAFTVNFHYAPLDTSKGGLALAGMSPDATDDAGITMYAGRDTGDLRKYMWEWILPNDLGEAEAVRTTNDGTLSASYDASLKKMVVSSGEGVLQEFDFSFIGLGDRLAVGLGGGSEGAVFSGSEAYFTNFNVTSGTPVAVPEPVSTILFITGGAVLAVRRLRRK